MISVRLSVRRWTASVVNAESGISAEELANEHFPGLGVERARRTIAFASSTPHIQLEDPVRPERLRKAGAYIRRSR